MNPGALARLRETTGDPLLVRAGRGLVPTPRARELGERVGRLVQEAAATVGAAAPDDLEAASEAVAARIGSIEPDEWDEARLERLRQLALDGGRVLREVESAARG